MWSDTVMQAGVTEGGVRGERRSIAVLEVGREMSMGGDIDDCTAVNFGDEAEVPSEERRRLCEGTAAIAGAGDWGWLIVVGR